MSTNDVPGANPANRDVLAVGCWAEHEDGSLIFVKSNEGGNVVYEIYDLGLDEVVYYQDRMSEKGFKDQFSYKSGSSSEKWTWRDKTPFPWDRVIKSSPRPVPQAAEAVQTLSAAARVAESLKLRAKQVDEQDIKSRIPQRLQKAGRAIMNRFRRDK